MNRHHDVDHSRVRYDYVRTADYFFPEIIRCIVPARRSMAPRFLALDCVMRCVHNIGRAKDAEKVPRLEFDRVDEDFVEFFLV